MSIVDCASELLTVELGDRRRRDRAVVIGEVIQQGSFTELSAMFSPAALEAVYGFTNNDEVESSKLLAPHYSASWNVRPKARRDSCSTTRASSVSPARSNAKVWRSPAHAARFTPRFVGCGLDRGSCRSRSCRTARVRGSAGSVSRSASRRSAPCTRERFAEVEGRGEEGTQRRACGNEIDSRDGSRRRRLPAVGNDRRNRRRLRDPCCSGKANHHWRRQASLRDSDQRTHLVRAIRPRVGAFTKRGFSFQTAPSSRCT